MKNVFLGIIAVFVFGCSKSSSDETTPTVDEFKTVKIGSQTWFSENLNVTKYRNGDVIPQVSDPTQWAKLTTGAWCYYNNDSNNDLIYGKLYNWYAIKDSRGLAPKGYHIPTDEEWTILTNFLGASAGGKMKNTTGWNGTNIGSTNNSGFTGLPGGFCINVQEFFFKETNGYWWSSTAIDSETAWNRSLNINSSSVCRSYDNKKYGFSVRCVKD